MMTVGPPTHQVSYHSPGHHATCICGWKSNSTAAGAAQHEWVNHLQEAFRRATIERFEYRCEVIPASIDVPDKIADWLNEFGADGWELAFWGSRACILKRRRA